MVASSVVVLQWVAGLGAYSVVGHFRARGHVGARMHLSFGAEGDVAELPAVVGSLIPPQLASA